MLGTGNSSVEACANCLLGSMQREIPFARSKGIDPEIYDAPFDDIGPYLDESARTVISAYEPRVTVDDIDLQFWQVEDEDGTYFTVSLSDNDGDVNDDDEGDDE